MFTDKEHNKWFRDWEILSEKHLMADPMSQVSQARVYTISYFHSISKHKLSFCCNWHPEARQRSHSLIDPVLRSLRRDVFCFSLSFTLHKCLAKENSELRQTAENISSFCQMIQSFNKTGLKTRYPGNECLRRPHFKESKV